ncbi:MAG: extracellular solute-binding protein [Halobacteriales archaeon]
MDTDRHLRRRAFIASLGGATVAGTAGCLDILDGEDDETPFNWIGSGPGRRLGDDGTPMSAMPDLEGELTLFSGRHEFLVSSLIDSIESLYDDFEVVPNYGGSSDLASTILLEGDGTDADVFFSVNAGALINLADQERLRTLSDEIRGLVREEFAYERWIGTSGRARTVPYNTDVLDEDDIPADVMAIPTDLDGTVGWAPSYGSCQAFVTAMRTLEGEEATRSWLESAIDAGFETYADEMRVCEAIANEEIDAGLTNHYYIQRVLANRGDAPIATAFTDGDAGAMFNVAGAGVVDATDDPELAENFVRHLLSAEAQAYFATETFEYPMAPDVDPVGDLPRITELDVPNIDLAELSDLQGTIDLMRDVGVDL